MRDWIKVFNATTRKNGGLRRSILVMGIGWPILGLSREESDASDIFLSVKMGPFFAKGDGFTDDWAAIDAAFRHASATGTRLYFPKGQYVIRAKGPGAVLLGRSGVRADFAPGAVLKLENPARYPLTCFFEHHRVEDVIYIGLALDGGGEVGPNGFGANNSKRIRCDDAHITGFRRDPRTGGGRGITFQFNCHDVQINNPSINRCTSGLDFHGRNNARLENISVNNPTISECEEAISFYSLADGNNHLNIGGDFQVTIKGGSARNCGKSTEALARGANGLGGGVIISERGRSFSIQDFSIVNESGYGKIGAVIRGSFSSSSVNIKYDGKCVALVMFSPASNLAPVIFNASSVSVGNLISIESSGDFDYIIYSDNTHGENLAAQNNITIMCIAPLIAIMNLLAGKGDFNFLEIVSLINSGIVRGHLTELQKKGAAFPTASGIFSY